ncbi:hypothetical protein CHU92_04330, partial [Flavobacterium cyanobacteriorum]
AAKAGGGEDAAPIGASREWLSALLLASPATSPASRPRLIGSIAGVLALLVPGFSDCGMYRRKYKITHFYNALSRPLINSFYLKQ